MQKTLELISASINNRHAKISTVDIESLGLILFFFALGAWIVALLLLFLDLSINVQLIIFVISSVITILLLRKWLSKILWKRNPSTELLEDEFLGKIAKAETLIAPGENGKVAFKGTSWQAASEDIIEKGENVIIIGNESILLTR